MINLRTTCLKYVMVMIVTFYAATSIAEDNLLSVSVDRTWGLLLGDEVNVNVDLTTLTDSVELSSLPAKDKRYGTWLYLKSIEQQAAQLVFHYQIVNVPLKNTLIDTPKFDIKQQDGEWAVISSTAITIGPSLAAESGAANIIAKADISPTLISTVAIEKQLKLFLLIAAITGLILAFWHFGWKSKNRQPFAQAVHDLSRLTWHAVTPDQAARILHTAFNHTSDTVVVYGEIDSLLAEHVWLMPLKQDIELFYQQSEQHFFARNAQQGPNIDDVRKLAKACRSKEMLA